MQALSKSTLNRLPTYLTYLRSLGANAPANISATAIANALNMGEVQVRKDLAAVSSSGKPKIGYATSNLIIELEGFLGYNDVTDAVVAGAGKLGRALLDYKGFNEYGLNIVAGFDINKTLEGTTDSGKQIFSLDRFGDLVKRMKIKIGIITVPAPHAQEVCDLMVTNGILAILNFAPVHLIAPDSVIIHNENIAASLAMLSNSLSEKIN